MLMLFIIAVYYYLIVLTNKTYYHMIIVIKTIQKHFYVYSKCLLRSCFCLFVFVQVIVFFEHLLNFYWIVMLCYVIALRSAVFFK